MLLLLVLPVHWLIFICWKICIYFWYLLCIIVITIHNPEIFYCVRDNVILVYTSILLVTTLCLLKKINLARQVLQQSWKLLRLRHWLSHKFCPNSCSGMCSSQHIPFTVLFLELSTSLDILFSDINCKYICFILFFFSDVASFMSVLEHGVMIWYDILLKKTVTVVTS